MIFKLFFIGVNGDLEIIIAYPNKMFFNFKFHKRFYDGRFGESMGIVKFTTCIKIYLIISLLDRSGNTHLIIRY